jgi:hypothetical protein
MEKHILINVPGASEEDAVNVFEIALEPGATVGETQHVLGLNGYLLRTESEDDAPLSESDNLYAMVRNWDQLWAAPPMDVGLQMLCEPSDGRSCGSHHLKTGRKL